MSEEPKDGPISIDLAIKKEDPRGTYSITKKLGDGNFACVRLATHKQEKKKYAIKVFEKAKLDADDIEALNTEIQAMLIVAHKNIVGLKEVYDTPDYFFMVLELCQGGELFDRIVELEHYSESQARHAFAQIVDAIDYCHKNNIVHRDLKPENLLYSGAELSSDLKVADFGLAYFLNPSEMLTTACGTPGYVAPEVLKRLGYGAPVDVWSLGIILYILLSGFPPFYEENTSDLFKAIKSGEYDFPSPWFDDVSDEAKDLISKILVVDPDKRISTQGIFQHPWMASEDISKAHLGGFSSNLKSYNLKRKFRSVAATIMMTNALKNQVVNNIASIAKETATASTPAPDTVTVPTPAP